MRTGGTMNDERVARPTLPTEAFTLTDALIACIERADDKRGGGTMNDERVSRRTLPTAAFTLTVSLIAWIERESAKRGVSKSEFLRDLLTDLMTESDKEVAAA